MHTHYVRAGFLLYCRLSDDAIGRQLRALTTIGLMQWGNKNSTVKQQMTFKRYILQKFSEKMCSDRYKHSKKSKHAIPKIIFFLPIVLTIALAQCAIFIVILIMQSDWFTQSSDVNTAS